MIRYVFILLIIITSCVTETKKNVTENKDWSVEHSIDFNKELHQREELAIKM